MLGHLCIGTFSSGLTLTHRGDSTNAQDGNAADRRMAALITLNEEGMKTFLEQIEKDELVEDEEEEVKRS